MRVLFLTQGSSLDTFYRLAQTMAAEQGLERAGFFVSDSRHFQESFLPAHPRVRGA